MVSFPRVANFAFRVGQQPQPQIVCCVFSGLWFLTNGVIQPPMPGWFKHSFAQFFRHPRRCARVMLTSLNLKDFRDCAFRCFGPEKLAR
jgi:hypothetical protein